MTWGTIIGPEGFKYQFTDEDFLWACRMVTGECGRYAWETKEGEAVLWTTVNRFVRMSDRFDTYTKLMRAFSQPINPSWYHGGSHDPNPGIMDPREMIRAAIANMTLEEFDARIVELVARFMRGKIPVDAYVGVNNFLAGSAWNTSMILPVAIPGVPLTREHNYFSIDPGTSVGWTKYTVRILSPAAMTSKPYVIGSLLLGAAGIVTLVVVR